MHSNGCMIAHCTASSSCSISSLVAIRVVMLGQRRQRPRSGSRVPGWWSWVKRSTGHRHSGAREPGVCPPCGHFREIFPKNFRPSPGGRRPESREATRAQAGRTRVNAYRRPTRADPQAGGAGGRKPGRRRRPEAGRTRVTAHRRPPNEPAARGVDAQSHRRRTSTTVRRRPERSRCLHRGFM